jgi:hypothetical protein
MVLMALDFIFMGDVQAPVLSTSQDRKGHLFTGQHGLDDIGLHFYGRFSDANTLNRQTHLLRVVLGTCC